MLRSTDYNTPIDIFALGAIIAEMYTMQPLFPGSSETDQINKICKILGTPQKKKWRKGFELAQQIGFKFPQCAPQRLSSIIQNASDSALELIEAMLQYDPNKRPTASQCLQYDYFKVKIPIPINASTTDLEDDDKEEFKQTFTDRRTMENFGEKFKSEVETMHNKGPCLSSLSMMKRARYKPSVNTKQFMINKND